jgi:hypothetical protein
VVVLFFLNFKNKKIKQPQGFCKCINKAEAIAKKNSPLKNKIMSCFF